MIPYLERGVSQGGSIVKWHKAEGEWVTPGDDLFDFLVAEKLVLQAASALSPAQILGRARSGQTVYDKRKDKLRLCITSSDMGFLRRIYAPEGIHQDVGDLAAILTTDENESLDGCEQLVNEASGFRVIANVVQRQ